MLICTYGVGKHSTCHITRFHFPYSPLHIVIRHHIKDRLWLERADIFICAWTGNHTVHVKVQPQIQDESRRLSLVSSARCQWNGWRKWFDLVFFFKNLFSLQSSQLHCQNGVGSCWDAFLNCIHFNSSSLKLKEYTFIFIPIFFCFYLPIWTLSSFVIQAQWRCNCAAKTFS